MGTPIINRNSVGGFGKRTIKNLRFIFVARKEGADVHVVTQLILSLLGLIVFPYEWRKKHNSKAYEIPYAELVKAGWPEWHVGIGQNETLDELINRLRNACSHHRIEFSSDSRKLHEVDITFWDAKGPKASPHWQAQINGASLADFVERFSHLTGK